MRFQHRLRGRRLRRRDDEGAVAVMVALLVVVLLGLAAMAVDLGHGFVQRQDTQKDADFAALYGAAGDNLPGTTPGSCSYGPKAAASDQAVQDVATYLTDHVKSNASSSAAQWVEAPTAAGLVDCDPDNGEALYGTVTITSSGDISLAYDPYHLTVVSPERRVDFFFAPVMDAALDGTEVSAQATAAIRSPAIGSVPLYAHNGCDWGRQTIAQPNGGHADPSVVLSHASETNAATLTRLETDPASDPPSFLVPAPDPAPLTIVGSSLKDVKAVGFFEPGGTEPVVVEEAGLTIVSPGTPETVKLNVPASVTTVPGDWYLRVRIGSQWSASGNALRLLIGTPTLTCGQGPSDGNFGTLRLSNSEGGGQSQQIARNIATGLDHTLAVHPSSADSGLCTGQPADVHWPNDGTNCVDTDPGMAADAAEMGFITGVGDDLGRLRNLDSGTGCAESGVPATTWVPVKKTTYQINNDTLSCFLTNDSTNIGSISSSAYSGGQVLSSRIFDSPRFLLIPVLKEEPTSGTSKTYKIVAFRPAFLTDQPNSATRSTGPSAGNGLTFTANGDLESVQVVFIHYNALPPIDVAQTTAYAGSGLRVIRLVD